MKCRPMLFSAPMVRALLAGRKTQTRRIVKMPPGVTHIDRDNLGWLAGDPSWRNCAWIPLSCPYGERGNSLWVRETWAHVPVTAYRCSDGVWQTDSPDDPDMAAVYAAGWDRSKPGRWRPSIHMPRWASRINLDITSVRIERLKGISEADAVAEGIEPASSGWVNYLWHGDHEAPAQTVDGWPHQFSNYSDPRGSYASLWERINGPDSWDANPWVWVITFRVVP
jgi:hypothetical protein